MPCSRNQYSLLKYSIIAQINTKLIKADCVWAEMFNSMNCERMLILRPIQVIQHIFAQT